MLNKKKLTISFCIVTLFIMMIVFYTDDSSITGEPVFKQNQKWQLSGNRPYKEPVQSTNLFVSKRGFFKHIGCVDVDGVGYGKSVWGSGENICSTDLSCFYSCNRLECDNGVCTRKFSDGKGGGNQCSFEHSRC